MTFHIKSTEAAIFFMVVFAAVSLVWLVGPKKRRSSSPWFGVTFLLLAVYACLARFAESDWWAIGAAGAAGLTFACGAIVSYRRREK
jgi:hypothetical protein